MGKSKKAGKTLAHTKEQTPQLPLSGNLQENLESSPCPAFSRATMRSRPVMPCTTARALHVRLCSEFTALGHVQWKKIEINFFGPFSSLFHPFSRHCFPRDLKVTHPSLERLESDSSKSRETWKWLIQVLRDLKVTHQNNQPLIESESDKDYD